MEDRELPKYKCHKVVHALKIARTTNSAGGDVQLDFERSEYAPMLVSGDWARRHDPWPGGYWVRYEDGYESWSPAAAFEAGYSEMLP
jgi:hypothetical protein